MYESFNPYSLSIPPLLPPSLWPPPPSLAGCYSIFCWKPPLDLLLCHDTCIFSSAIYLTCFNLKVSINYHHKKQDVVYSRNKTEEIIRLTVAHLHICAIKVQRASEEMHPSPEGLQILLIAIYEMLLVSRIHPSQVAV